MTDHVNGSPPPAAPAEQPLPGEHPPQTVHTRPVTLTEAKELLRGVLMAGIRRPDGNYAVDGLELYINSEVDACRVSAIAELMLAKGLITVEELAASTIDKIGRRMLDVKQNINNQPRILTRS